MIESLAWLGWSFLVGTLVGAVVIAWRYNDADLLGGFDDDDHD